MTTRRDILTTMIAAPVALLLPEVAGASAAPQPNRRATAESYLSGYAAFNDILGVHRADGHIELYVDDQKAIIRVGIEEAGRVVAWKEYVFVQPVQISMMSTICTMLKEMKP